VVLEWNPGLCGWIYAFVGEHVISFISADRWCCEASHRLKEYSFVHLIIFGFTTIFEGLAEQCVSSAGRLCSVRVVFGALCVPKLLGDRTYGLSLNQLVGWGNTGVLRPRAA